MGGQPPFTALVQFMNDSRVPMNVEWMRADEREWRQFAMLAPHERDSHWSQVGTKWRMRDPSGRVVVARTVGEDVKPVIMRVQ